MTDIPLIDVSAVAIEGRAVLIEGVPGSGKSSLALALIDRGAKLIGDDGVMVQESEDKLVVMPPPNIAGLLEIRGVGIVELAATRAPLALILALEDEAPRMPEAAETRVISGCAIPLLPFRSGDSNAALRAEWALRVHGLTF